MTRPHLAVVVLAVTALAAQDDLPRQRLFGVALRADRSPWVGARVHACAAGPWTFAIGVPDQVTALTDARGRFHVDVLGGRKYSVWAEQELADDMAFVSETCASGWAGERIELMAMAEAKAAPQLVLRGLTRDLALPLRAVVHHPVAGLVEEFAIDALDGGGASRPLTPVPPGQPAVTVRDAAGAHVLAIANAGTTSPSLAPAPARWLRVRVEDHATRTGIADAAVLAIDGALSVIVATTDEAGVAVFDTAPYEALFGDPPQRRPGAAFVTSARGFGLGKLDPGKLAGHPTRAAALAAALPDLVVQPRNGEGQPIRLRLHAGDALLAGAVLHMSALVTQPNESGGTIGGAVTLGLRADAGGLVELPGPPSSLPTMSAAASGPAIVHLALDAPLLRRLPVAWRERLPATLPIILPAARAAGQAEPIDVDLLRDFRPIDLELIAADGATPAAGIDVRCDALSSPNVALVRSDRAGRVRVLAPISSADALAVATIGEHGWCAQRLDPGTAAPDLRDVARIRVQLASPLRVEVRITHGLLPRLPESLQLTWSQIATADRFAGAAVNRAKPSRDPSLAPLDPPRQIQLLRMFATRRGVLGDRATILLPSLPAQLKLNVTGRLDAQRVRTSGSFALVGDEGSVTFELAFDR